MMKTTVIFSLFFALTFFTFNTAEAQVCPSPSRGGEVVRTTTTKRTVVTTPRARRTRVVRSGRDFWRAVRFVGNTGEIYRRRGRRARRATICY